MSEGIVDQARDIRPGEELDTGKLDAYLKENIPGLAGQLVVEQFPRGYSNLTYLIKVGERDMVLRRPPFGANIKSAHDMGREYRILSRLGTAYPKVPRALVYCEDPAVLGAPFYVMERVTGVILRATLPEGMTIAPDRMRRVSEATIDNLAAIHAVDYRAADLGELGRPEGYVERQVTGWIGRYDRARTDDIPTLDRAARWLVAHKPAESGAALIHNDYKYDNLALDPADLSRINAVLDWEMATVGDPLMDLGTTLGYWVERTDAPDLQALRFGCTTLPGNLTRAEVVERYARASGRDVSNIVFYYVFGLYKIAVISQQIYARYKQGLTKDERFGLLIHAVRAISDAAVAAIDKNRMD
jgi:aminoglycoside phosphotransferase (APT) family kinase protein